LKAKTKQEAKPRQEARPKSTVTAKPQVTAKPAAPKQSAPKPAAPKQAAPKQEAPRETFEDMDISDTMLDALEDAGYEYPTPIQAGLIPRALEGVDVLGQARTGTGKTASFVIPILELLRSGREAHKIQALVMVPTRELAVQVREEVVKLSAGRRVNCVAVYGGKPIKGQIDKLKKGAHIVVGTPGRVLDHLARGTIDLSGLTMVVLDEADRMLDIGFRPDIEKILKRCPEDRQTLLLSATVPPSIAKLAERYMYEPEVMNFSEGDVSVETIEQFYFTVDPERKFDLLMRLIDREEPKQTIVFCRTKRGTEKIFQRLSKKLDGVAAIHGDMGQGARDRTMEGFRSGRVRHLVATDVVGRGIDVSSVSHIINYDIPAFCDDYVHRVGRTGRMGRDGVAYTFVAPDEGYELTRIEQRINRELKRAEMKDFEFKARERLGGSGEQDGKPIDRGPSGSSRSPRDSEGSDGVAPPPPPTSMMRRPPKKYRRAL
jgi:ATP-dependent RNA helicase DeaD